MSMISAPPRRQSLLPERIRVLLGVDRIDICRDGTRSTLALAGEGEAPRGRDGEAPRWRAGLAALDAALAANPPRRPAAGWPAVLTAPLAARLELVVDERFARWLLLPWQPELTSIAEIEALARYHLREIHGEAVRHWTLACAERPAGEPTPVCAIDGELPVALGAIAASHGCRLDGVEPLFAAAADHWRRQLPRGIVWFALLSDEHLRLGLLRDRCWLAIHGETLPAADVSGDAGGEAAGEAAGEALAGLIARSALAAGLAPDAGQLLLCGERSASCRLPLAGMPVTRLGAALHWLAPPAAGDSTPAAGSSQSPEGTSR
jgi:hypothetical protein